MVRTSRKRYQTRHLDLFYRFLRNQEVDGSNPFAPTTLSIPASHWLTLLSLFSFSFEYRSPTSSFACPIQKRSRSFGTAFFLSQVRRKRRKA